MAGKLQDKICVITGGSLGIGSGTAKECAREGAKVAILDIHVAGGESTVADIREAGRSAIFIETDVSQAHQVQTAVKRVLDEYGRIDVLVNAAALQVQAPVLTEVTGRRVGHRSGHQPEGAFPLFQVRYPGDVEGWGRGDCERVFIRRTPWQRLLVALRCRQGGVDPAHQDYQCPVLSTGDTGEQRGPGPRGHSRGPGS